jgi:hypothetical protein
MSSFAVKTELHPKQKLIDSFKYKYPRIREFKHHLILEKFNNHIRVKNLFFIILQFSSYNFL